MADISRKIVTVLVDGAIPGQPPQPVQLWRGQALEEVLQLLQANGWVGASSLQRRVRPGPAAGQPPGVHYYEVLRSTANLRDRDELVAVQRSQRLPGQGPGGGYSSGYSSSGLPPMHSASHQGYSSGGAAPGASVDAGYSSSRGGYSSSVEQGYSSSAAASPNHSMMSNAEEGMPPASAELLAELSAMRLRALGNRAVEMGVDEDAVDAAEERDQLIALIVAKVEENANAGEQQHVLAARTNLSRAQQQDPAPEPVSSMCTRVRRKLACDDPGVKAKTKCAVAVLVYLTLWGGSIVLICYERTTCEIEAYYYSLMAILLACVGLIILTPIGYGVAWLLNGLAIVLSCGRAGWLRCLRERDAFEAGCYTADLLCPCLESDDEE
jgi:hypothetical protein